MTIGNEMAMTAPAPRVLADILPKSWIRNFLLVIVAAGFVGLAAQITIPLGFTPVPLTGQTFAVLLAGAALGSIRGAIAMLLYAVAGMVGVPWFAHGASGFSLPSFGYVVGFILAAGLVGFLAERGWSRTALDTALAMVLGNVVIYASGVVWLKFALHTSWGSAVALGMSPFLFGDAIKIAFAAALFPLVWRQLSRAGLAPGRTSEAEAEAEAEEATSDAEAEAEATTSESDSEGLPTVAEAEERTSESDDEVTTPESGSEHLPTAIESEETTAEADVVVDLTESASVLVSVQGDDGLVESGAAGAEETEERVLDLSDGRESDEEDLVAASGAASGRRRWRFWR